ncbi:FkbM family methyltransferase [Acidisoma cellulosilytica]|uniref:FkbM family methyltransferase n=1 Tax=Acidisoma cellulosilyticum TaxID=2802395 RepID=A0A963Z5V8_9PROT|nr:FkbM family methyltransferase [Acidisoma cellulosilyticum]MCB8883168.1 FkbM family methyltransferase [Acidisoma cellulosilyticum]
MRKRGARSTEPAPWEFPYSSTATESDILACFRLLLGRMPNQEEWRGHSSRAGEELSSIVASYLTSLEFARRRLGHSALSDDVVLTRLAEFSIYSSSDDASVGRYVREDNYEREVAHVFQSVLKEGMSVLDIGANIGYFTMLSAALVGPTGRVLAIEPNPRNVRLIEASRRANGFENVRIVQTAAGRETGLLILNTSHSNGTTSGLPADVRQLLDAETVACVRLDALLGEQDRVDFIKVDVEGAEYNALLGGIETIRRNRPVIVTEFGPSMMPGISGITGKGYLEWITALDYDLSIVEPDGTLNPCGRDVDRIMTVILERETDHIDLVALPR